MCRLKCDRSNCEYNIQELCKAGGAYYIEGKLHCPYKERPKEKPVTTADLMAVAFRHNCEKSGGKWRSPGRKVWK